MAACGDHPVYESPMQCEMACEGGLFPKGTNTVRLEGEEEEVQDSIGDTVACRRWHGTSRWKATRWRRSIVPTPDRAAMVTAERPAPATRIAPCSSARAGTCTAHVSWSQRAGRLHHRVQGAYAVHSIAMATTSMSGTTFPTRSRALVRASVADDRDLLPLSRCPQTAIVGTAIIFAAPPLCSPRASLVSDDS